MPGSVTDEGGEDEQSLGSHRPRLGLAGRYELRLLTSGVLLLSVPPSFEPFKVKQSFWSDLNGKVLALHTGEVLERDIVISGTSIARFDSSTSSKLPRIPSIPSRMNDGSFSSPSSASLLPVRERM